MSVWNYSNTCRLQGPFLSPGMLLMKPGWCSQWDICQKPPGPSLPGHRWAPTSSHCHTAAEAGLCQAASSSHSVEKEKANVRDHRGRRLWRSQTWANQGNVAAVALVVLCEFLLTGLFRKIPSKCHLWPQKPGTKSQGTKGQGSVLGHAGTQEVSGWSSGPATSVHGRPRSFPMLHWSHLPAQTGPHGPPHHPLFPSPASTLQHAHKESTRSSCGLGLQKASSFQTRPWNAISFYFNSRTPFRFLNVTTCNLIWIIQIPEVGLPLPIVTCYLHTHTHNPQTVNDNLQ